MARYFQYSEIVLKGMAHGSQATGHFVLAINRSEKRLHLACRRVFALEIWPGLLLPLGSEFRHPAHAIAIRFSAQHAALAAYGDHILTESLVLIHAEVGERTAMMDYATYPLFLYAARV